MENYWIIITPLLLTIGGLATWGLNSYIGEKLKNIATHEDIGRITKQVESVKQVFTAQTEKIKQELSVLTNKQNVLFNEEKEALIDYLSAWNIWFNKLNKMVNNYKEQNYYFLKDIRNGWNKLSKENIAEDDRIQICISKLEFFINDKELIKAVHNLKNKTYEFQVLNENYISNYMVNDNEKVALLGDLPMDGTKPKEALSNSIEILQNKMKNELNEYNSSMLNLYGQIAEHKQHFIFLSKEYIRKGILE